MKRKLLSLTIAMAVITAPLLNMGLRADAVSAVYNDTAIDSNLNATAVPDHVMLSWTGDPSTTQTIVWRTSTAVTSGQVQYRIQGTTDFTTFNVPAQNIKTFTTVSTEA